MPGLKRSVIYISSFLLCLCILNLVLIPCLHADEIPPDNLSLKYRLKSQFILDPEKYRFNTNTDSFCDLFGNLYLLFTDNNLIIKINSKGEVIKSTGGFGFGVNQFNNPISIASNDQGLNMYLLDEGNNRIVRLNSNLAWVDEIEYGTVVNSKSIGQLKKLAINSSGDFYISDPHNHRIIILSNDGKYKSEIIGKGKPISAGSMHIDNDDFILIMDMISNSVLLYDEFDNYIKTFILPDSLNYNTLTLKNNLMYFYNQSTHAINTYSYNKTNPEIIEILFDPPVDNLDIINMKISSNGRIWIFDSKSNRILGYDPVRK